jgi:zinc transporter ZupT
MPLFKPFFATALVWAAASIGVASAAEDEHGHAAHKWAFAAVYDLHESAEHGNYTLNFGKMSGKYADHDCKLLIFPTSKETADGIESVEDTAEELYEKNATSGAVEVLANSFSTVLMPKSPYILEFDSSVYRSSYKFFIGQDGPHVFFFQHFTSEFSFELLDAAGKKYEPTATEPAPKAKDDHHDEYVGNIGLGFVGVIITAFCTLVGILVLLPCGKCCTNMRALDTLSAGFAAGVLMAVTLLMLLPECVRIIDSAWKSDEALNNFFLGIAAFVGFFSNAFIYWFFCADNVPSEILPTAEKGVISPTKEQPAQSVGFALNPKGWNNIVWSILLGDFIHNFADGMAIMMAFKMCSPSMGWAVMAGAVAHELPQEFADFMVLRNAGNMSAFEALFTNFTSGLSCIIGGAIVAAVEVSKPTKVFVLQVAGGAYLWIACVECFPKLLKVKRASSIIHHIIAFTSGFGLIAAMLVFHTHCSANVTAVKTSAPGAVDPHAGHGH